MIDYIFDEDKYLKEAKDHIDSTYNNKYHYSGEYQATEVIIDAGHGTGFNIGNILKYAKRYGKKDGRNRKDLLKIIHYAIIQLSVQDKEDKTAAALEWPAKKPEYKETRLPEYPTDPILQSPYPQPLDPFANPGDWIKYKYPQGQIFVDGKEYDINTYVDRMPHHHTNVLPYVDTELKFQPKSSSPFLSTTSNVEQIIVTDGLGNKGSLYYDATSGKYIQKSSASFGGSVEKQENQWSK